MSKLENSSTRATSNSLRQPPGREPAWNAKSLPHISWRGLSILGGGLNLSLAFSPDGKILLASVAYTGTTDLDTRIFLLDPDDLVALAKTRVTRTLTTEECLKYLHVEQCPPEP